LAKKPWALLIAKSAKVRSFFYRTTDGFKIAEADLELRGPGELLGQQQSGATKLRFGNLADDLSLIRQARKMVARHV
jgi:ATP-dependent DNA helicase RecG